MFGNKGLCLPCDKVRTLGKAWIIYLVDCYQGTIQKAAVFTVLKRNGESSSVERTFDSRNIFKI